MIQRYRGVFLQLPAKLDPQDQSANFRILNLGLDLPHGELLPLHFGPSAGWQIVTFPARQAGGTPLDGRKLRLVPFW